MLGSRALGLATMSHLHLGLTPNMVVSLHLGLTPNMVSYGALLYGIY